MPAASFDRSKKSQLSARDSIPTKVKSPSTSQTMSFHASAQRHAMWVRFSMPALGQLVPKSVVPGADPRQLRSDHLLILKHKI